MKLNCLVEIIACWCSLSESIQATLIQISFDSNLQNYLTKTATGLILESAACLMFS